MSVFDKFTTYYKQALIASHITAEKLQCPLVEMEHLLYGIMTQKGSIGYEMLIKVGMSAEKLFRSILHPRSRQQGDMKKDVRTKLSKESEALLLQSVTLAAVRHHRYIGTEHLLMAMLEKRTEDLNVICLKLNIPLNALKAHVISALKGTSKFSELARTFEEGGEFEYAFDRGGVMHEHVSALETYAVDLTSEEVQMTIDPIIGRDKEIERVIHILARRVKNNPLLLGDPGVGKTAIVEGIAKKIVEGDIPPILFEKRIYKVDMAALLAGTIYRGEFEARVKQLLEEVKQNPEIILFIDEMHTVIGAGASTGSLDTANILKPALARGEMRLIGATTFEEYKKHMAHDRAFVRRMQIVSVDEPSAKKTQDILEGLKKYYETYHKVKIHDEAITSAVELSNQYLTERYFPDKALDLIDEASAKVKTQGPKKIHLKELKTLEHRLVATEREKEEAIIVEDFEKAQSLQEIKYGIEKEMEKFTVLLTQARENQQGEIRRRDILEVLANTTGIPFEHLNQEQEERLLELEKNLAKKVLGQTKALHTICNVLKRARAGISHPNRPLASFLFVGSSGVGKTETAKLLAHLLYERPDAFLRLDMSEFSEKFHISKLIGAPAGYVGYKDTNTLADRIKRNPYSIVLFDEIEKAHADIHALLLQILEDGQLTDAGGTKINFKNCVIILTSNIAQNIYNKGRVLGFQKREGKKEKKIIEEEEISLAINKELEKRFKIEFLNRIDDLVIFQKLEPPVLKKIARLQIAELNERLQATHITIKAEKEVYAFLAEHGYQEKFGARFMRKNIQEHVETPLAEMILKRTLKAGDTVIIKKEKKGLYLAREDVVSDGK